MLKNQVFRRSGGWNHTFIAGMDGRWNEHWQCCRFYDYRPGNKDYESGSRKNCIRIKAVCAVSFVCYGICNVDRNNYKYILLR